MIAAAEYLDNTTLPIPSNDQLNRWIMLSLKWPGVVRWLYWGLYENPSNSSETEMVQTRRRLELLENISVGFEKDKDWIKSIETKLRIKADSISWVYDKRFWEFFQEEKERKEGKLSASAGYGLY